MNDPHLAPRRAWVPGQRLTGPREDWSGDGAADAPRIGVLALQGGVLEHLRALRRCGARPLRIRRPEDLDDLDGVVVPGGESTTIGKLAGRFDLLDPLRERIAGGLPTLGTCAGMILLSRELEQDFDQPLLGVLAVRTRRNAFGRQVASFDVRLDVDGIDGGPVDVSFIRAPWVEQVLSDEVSVLAEVEGHPVVVEQAGILATAFHAELTGDDRLHQRFVDHVRTTIR